MPNMVQDIVDHATTRYGEKTALIDGEHVLSFVEVNERFLRLAERLRGLGVQKGDAVAVQLPNSWEFVIAHLALARLGAIMVPINLVYRQKELSFMFSFAHVKAVIAIDEWKGFNHAKMMESLRQTIPTLQHIIIVGERKHPDHYSFKSRVLIIQNYTYAFHKFGHTQTKQRPSRISNREEAAQRKNGERTK
ncbi:hypothetical protein ETC03_20425 [Geobacillus sp. MMMUD3]|nr:hypothetical protein [Geobacillus sp. MMMUD3]